MTDDKKVVKKPVNEVVRQESIPEETSHDISPTRVATSPDNDIEPCRKLVGDTRAQIVNYKSDIGMDEIKSENDIVRCK